MLLPQAPPRYQRKLRRGSRQAEARLVVGVPGVRGELRRSRRSLYEPDRLDRLALAERLLHRSGKVGKLGDNTPWIDDELIMRWGYIYDMPYSKETGPLAVVFFASRDEHIVALSGSARHVVGNELRPRKFYGASKAPFWSTARMWEYYEGRESVRGLTAVAAIRLLRDTFNIIVGRPANEIVDPFRRAVEMERYLEDWPEQRVRFLAQRLMDNDKVQYPRYRGPSPVRVTIGSPLYVQDT
jgi:hypothetical protein